MAAQIKPIHIYEVVHPLHDIPEAKRNPAELGLIQMSQSVRISLLILRGYLVGMGCLLAYRMVVLSGLLAHTRLH